MFHSDVDFGVTTHLALDVPLLEQREGLVHLGVELGSEVVLLLKIPV